MKCPHGVYIPQFYSDKSPYCSACHPHGEADRPLKLSLTRRRPVVKPEREDAGAPDAAQFMEHPAGARLAEMGALCDG